MTNWDGSKEHNSPASPSLSLQVAYTTKIFDYGIRADLYRLRVLDPLNMDHTGGGVFYINMDYNYYPIAFNCALFVNWKKQIDRSSVFLGPQMGYVFGTSQSLSYSYSPPISGPDPFSRPSNGVSSGVTLGLQAGYSYSLYKGLKLKTEIAPRFLYSLNGGGIEDYDHSLNTILIPVSIGASYSL